MRYCALGVAVFVIGYLATCSLRGDNSMATNSLPHEEITALRPVAAVLNEGTLSSVNATETQIKGKPGPPFQFRQAQFINETHGWAMTLYSLYRTTDGGKTWERLSQEPEKDAQLRAFTFVDELHGWMAIVKMDSAKSYGLGISSVIMVTEDGGRSWKLQASYQDEIQINDVRFLNENEGLAVGHKGLENRADRAEICVLGTSNGGKEWNDISGAAKAAFRNQWGVANDSGTYLKWTPSWLLMLTQGGRVMSTPDRGKTWNTIVILKYENPGGFITGTAFYNLVLDPQEEIRVIGGAAGDEGYHGEFVIPEQGQWTTYEISATPIDDAVFLSDKEVIASGLNVRRTTDKSKLRDAGVILRSFDGGKSWQTIYRSKTFETFFYITKVSDNQFYAVSDTGTFLRFNLPQ